MNTTDPTPHQLRELLDRWLRTAADELRRAACAPRTTSAYASGSAAAAYRCAEQLAAQLGEVLPSFDEFKAHVARVGFRKTGIPSKPADAEAFDRDLTINK